MGFDQHTYIHIHAHVHTHILTYVHTYIRMDRWIDTFYSGGQRERDLLLKSDTRHTFHAFREESLGEKMRRAELMGFPWMIVLGGRAPKDGSLEVCELPCPSVKFPLASIHFTFDPFFHWPLLIASTGSCTEAPYQSIHERRRISRHGRHSKSIRLFNSSIRASFSIATLNYSNIFNELIQKTASQ